MSIEKELKEHATGDLKIAYETENGEFYKDENGNLFAIVLDQELDPIRVEFHNDGGVYFDVKDYTYINLCSGTLMVIACLVDDAEDYYRKEYNGEV